ncbi:protein PFC0760c-like [Aphidius gifuensis]|uniref:protein PFC0760c-like n=1 Tax=Aphidius gifuensis TaxID=684658 RepID=UPI001CDBBC2A|nr:protein PFC0760c-like [Aphidius gifuensis]
MCSQGLENILKELSCQWSKYFNSSNQFMINLVNEFSGNTSDGTNNIGPCVQAITSALANSLKKIDLENLNGCSTTKNISSTTAMPSNEDDDEYDDKDDDDDDDDDNEEVQTNPKIIETNVNNEEEDDENNSEEPNNEKSKKKNKNSKDTSNSDEDIDNVEDEENSEEPNNDDSNDSDEKKKDKLKSQSKTSNSDEDIDDVDDEENSEEPSNDDSNADDNLSQENNDDDVSKCKTVILPLDNIKKLLKKSSFKDGTTIIILDKNKKETLYGRVNNKEDVIYFHPKIIDRCDQDRYAIDEDDIKEFKGCEISCS